MPQEDRCAMCISWLLSGAGRRPECPARGFCRLWLAVSTK